MCVSGQVLPAHVPVQRGGGRGAEDGDHRQEEHAHGQEGRHVLLGHVVACHQLPLHVIIWALCVIVSVVLSGVSVLSCALHSEGSAAALAQCKQQIQFLWDPISWLLLHTLKCGRIFNFWMFLSITYSIKFWKSLNSSFITILKFVNQKNIYLFLCWNISTYMHTDTVQFFAIFCILYLMTGWASGGRVLAPVLW